MNVGKYIQGKNAFIIYIKNKDNRVTGEIPRLIDLLKKAISNFYGRFIQSFQI